MKITQVIETPEGVFSFNGEINQEEHDVLVEAGFKLLFGLGLLPFAMEKINVEDIPKEQIN